MRGGLLLRKEEYSTWQKPGEMILALAVAGKNISSAV